MRATAWFPARVDSEVDTRTGRTRGTRRSHDAHARSGLHMDSEQEAAYSDKVRLVDRQPLAGARAGVGPLAGVPGAASARGGSGNLVSVQR